MQKIQIVGSLCSSYRKQKGEWPNNLNPILKQRGGKAKQSHCGPGQPRGFQEDEAHKVSKVVSPTPYALYPQEILLVLIAIRG
jgi:hypothetical protein